MIAPLAPGTRIVVATHNAGKLSEFADLLAPYGLEAVSAGDLGLDEPEETGTTFEDNARLKARHAAEASGLVALADDSGLAVDALGGEPGVYSARWAGPEKDFRAAMKKVEDRLDAAVTTDRRARFVAVICMAEPAGGDQVFRGETAGDLLWPPRGTAGFGYDPMFRPDGMSRTFGEMTLEEKQGHSHRARAFAAMAAVCLERARS